MSDDFQPVLIIRVSNSSLPHLGEQTVIRIIDVCRYVSASVSDRHHLLSSSRIGHEEFDPVASGFHAPLPISARSHIFWLPDRDHIGPCHNSNSLSSFISS